MDVNFSIEGEKEKKDLTQDEIKPIRDYNLTSEQ